MRNAWIVALLVCIGSPLSGQTRDASCCRLAAATDAEAPSVLKVTITNLKATAIDISMMRPEIDLDLIVRTEFDREPERTEYGKRLLTDERSGSRRSSRLQKGESFSQDLDLGQLFVLIPGTYTVSIKRAVWVVGIRVTLRTKVAVRIP